MNRSLAFALGTLALLLVGLTVWLAREGGDGTDLGIGAGTEVGGTSVARRIAERPVAPTPVPDLPPSPPPDETPPPEPEEVGTVGDLLVRALPAGGSRGVPGVTVVVVLHDGQVGTEELSEVTHTTDERGEVRLTDIRRGDVNVRLVQGERRSVFVRAGRATELILRLEDGFTVDGVVVDGRDRPVPGAEIWLSERGRDDRGHIVATADEKGRFHLGSLSEHHLLAARSRDLAPSLTVRPKGRPGENVRVELKLDGVGTAIAGTVTDAEGAPVSGALVRARFDREDGSRRRRPPLRSRTDETGRFDLSGIPIGIVSLQVRAGRFAPWQDELLTRPGEVQELTVRLEREAIVRGLVTDELGDPVAGARVRTIEVDLFLYSITFSGDDGAFRLPGLPTGPVRLEADRRDIGREAADFDLLAGEERTYDFRLEPVPSIRGRIVDHEHRPLPGWTVVAFESLDRNRYGRAEPSDEAGRFIIPEVRRVSHLLVVTEPDGSLRFPRLVQDGVFPLGSEQELVVPDPALVTGTIEGRVVDVRGAPVPGAELHLHFQEHDLWRVFSTDRTSGTFAIELVPVGRYDVGVSSAAHPWRLERDVRVAAGVTQRLGDLVLADPGRIVGTLRYATGAPVGPVELLLLDAAGLQVRGGVTREADDFVSPPLAPGSYRLQVTGDRVTSRELTITVETGIDRELDLVLEPAALRRFVVRPPPGSPTPQSMHASLLDAAGAVVWGRGYIPAAADGSFDFTASAPPGAYRIAGRTNDGLRLTGELEIPDLQDAPAPVVLILEP